MVRRVIGAAICLVALVAGGTPYAAAESEVGSTCAGRAVTISWQPGVPTINGTGGPDVIQGGPRDETINAGGGEDVVCGGGGADLIDGGTGRDELLGQDGSDRFKGADLGQDVVTGGIHADDKADYRQLPAGVGVNETTGLVHMTGAGVDGGILGVERVLGTNFDDHLIGGTGNDTLFGRGGNDTIEGRGGADDLDGSIGTDTVTYQAASAAVVVDFSRGAGTIGTTADYLTDFEQVIGTRFDDRIVGISDPEHFVGGGGDDVLKGRGGDDVLDGGGGDDVIHPGPGDDEVDGGNNDPVTSSGEHGDLVSYQGDTSDRPNGWNGLDAYLAPGPLGSPPGADGVGHDEFSGVESVRGLKNGQNHFEGNDGPNVLIGGDGQDFFVGDGGNDLIFGLAGVDNLAGDNDFVQPPGPYGDDYLDAGGPTGENDGDFISAGLGDDTCTGAKPEFTENCETQF